MKKKKYNKIRRRWETSFGRGSIISGILVSIVAWLIYKFITNDFLFQSSQEILGFGVILIITGLVFVFLGKRLEKLR